MKPESYKQYFESQSSCEILDIIYDYKTTQCLKGNKIIVSSFPKSGSSFLSVLLGTLTRYQPIRLTRYFEGSEQDLYYPLVIDNYSKNSVIQHHFKGTDKNIQLLKKFDYKIIVLVRDIFDIVPSLRDFIVNRNFLNILVGSYDPSFLEKNIKEQYDQIIQMSIPWYFHFYISWFKAHSNKEIPIIWITYEKLISDSANVLNQICNFSNIEKSQEEIITAIAKVQQKSKQDQNLTLLNKGIAGRGKTALSTEQKTVINSYASLYPNVDFSLIGIKGNME